MSTSQEETVIVDINEEGVPTISVVGVKGSGCKALTASLENRLGIVTTDVPTEEMHQKEITNAAQQQQRRNA